MVPEQVVKVSPGGSLPECSGRYRCTFCPHLPSLCTCTSACALARARAPARALGQVHKRLGSSRAFKQKKVDQNLTIIKEVISKLVVGGSLPECSGRYRCTFCT